LGIELYCSENILPVPQYGAAGSVIAKQSLREGYLGKRYYGRLLKVVDEKEQLAIDGQATIWSSLLPKFQAPFGSTGQCFQFITHF